MVAARMVILAISVSTATFSRIVICILSSLTMLIKLFSFFFEILVPVLLSILYDYFNGSVHTCSLGIATQIKNTREPLLIFVDIWFDIYGIIFLAADFEILKLGIFLVLEKKNWLLSEKYNSMPQKKKSLKTSEISSLSYRIYFYNP
jgi:hypothetical protein